MGIQREGLFLWRFRPQENADQVAVDAVVLLQDRPDATCTEMARFAHALWEEKLLNPAYTRLTLSPKLSGLPPPGPIPLTVFTGYGPGVTLAGDR